MVTVKPPSLSLFGLLSLNTQGDAFGFTFYTSKRKKLVFFPQAPPKVPPSVHQTIRRNHWSRAIHLWRWLDKANRQQWLDMARAARLRISGYNLFIYVQVTGDTSVVATLARLTGIDPINHPAQD